MRIFSQANAAMTLTSGKRPDEGRYEDVIFTNDDGLDLYARDYPNPDAQLTVLCLHGLTRNSADFADLAAALQPDLRVVAMDQRGRGRSAYDPDPSRYALPTYVKDAFAMMDHLALERVAIIGTSMGGLMAMFMTAQQPARISGVVLNDVGPVVEAAGLRRIQSYVGKGGEIASWADAVALTRANNGAAFPDLTEADWLTFARRLFVENDAGVPLLAYDAKISQPMQADQTAAVPPDLWPVFDTLREVPLLVVRGSLSDILSRETVEEMARHHPGLTSVEVANRGHAPMLDEPEAMEAVTGFLAALPGSQG
jgi:pimeloyl-ACP methyl ester carboxylesterase